MMTVQERMDLTRKGMPIALVDHISAPVGPPLNGLGWTYADVTYLLTAGMTVGDIEVLVNAGFAYNDIKDEADRIAKKAKDEKSKKKLDDTEAAIFKPKWDIVSGMPSLKEAEGLKTCASVFENSLRYTFWGLFKLGRKIAGK